MYSDTGRLNCNISYTTFATPDHGQVYQGWNRVPLLSFFLLVIDALLLTSMSLTEVSLMLGIRQQGAFLNAT